jgi:hypothetical protein
MKLKNLHPLIQGPGYATDYNTKSNNEKCSFMYFNTCVDVISVSDGGYAFNKNVVELEFVLTN